MRCSGSEFVVGMHGWLFLMVIIQRDVDVDTYIQREVISQLKALVNESSKDNKFSTEARRIMSSVRKSGLSRSMVPMTGPDCS